MLNKFFFSRLSYVTPLGLFFTPREFAEKAARAYINRSPLNSPTHPLAVPTDPSEEVGTIFTCHLSPSSLFRPNAAVADGGQS